MPNGMDFGDVVRHRVLFTLIERAAGKEHWKYPFEMEIILASKEYDKKIPKEDVAAIAKELASAIQFFHGAAVTIDLDTREVRPRRGEPAAYVLFDGYKLTIGSTGYQG